MVHERIMDLREKRQANKGKAAVELQRMREEAAKAKEGEKGKAEDQGWKVKHAPEDAWTRQIKKSKQGGGKQFGKK